MAKVSVKHLQMDKNQQKMLGVIVLTIVVVVFGIFATRSMVIKGFYQRRALHARRDVIDQLKDNVKAANTLFTQYKVFADQEPNILGGTKTGDQNNTGDNPRIVLDALPSKYDAPALATSIEKILKGKNIAIESLTLTDESATNLDDPLANPEPKPMIFSFTGNTDFKGNQDLLKDFERSIRPFDVNTLEITGTDKKLKITVGATTYYLPAKSLDLKATKEVK